MTFRKKFKIKTIVGLFLLVLISLTMTGCWNRREMNDITLSTAIGIDRVVVDGRPIFLFSVLAARPAVPSGGATAGGGGGTTGPRVAGVGTVISTEGETVYDAIRNYSMRTSRQLFLSHSLVIVFGEEMAKEGIGEVLDFCNRQKDIRERTWVVVCEGLARDALQSQPEMESITSVELNKMIPLNQSRASKVAIANLFQVTRDLLTPGKEAAVSNIKLFVPPETSSPIRPTGTAQTPGSPSGKGGGAEIQAQNKTFALSGAAVFRGDRMVGRMDEEETQGMLFIKNQADGGIIPIAFSAPEKNASFLYRDVKAKVKPVINEDGSIMFEIRINGKVELQEQKNAAIDIAEEDIKHAEELINQEVERRCIKAVARSKELKSDVFGFGEKIYRSKPKAWEEIQSQWGEIFPIVIVSVTADFKIEHLGLINKPIVIQ